MRSELEAIVARRDTNSLDAFYQIHLATAVERAVYRRFASDPHACWSDAETAFAARLDISKVRWALERFADAGIVEVVEEGCYRWRPGLRYVLEHAEPETERRDPVCGMPVAVDAPYRAGDARADHGVRGQTSAPSCSSRSAGRGASNPMSRPSRHRRKPRSASRFSARTTVA